MAALLGPADADHYRVQVGKYAERWYTDPLPSCDIAEALLGDEAWPSVSTVKKASGADWSMVAHKRIGTRLADPAELDRLRGLPAGEIVRMIRMWDEAGLDRAANRGTGVHLLAETLLAGADPRQAITSADEIDKPGITDALAYLDALEAIFAAYQFRLVAKELVCVHRTLNGYGYGGTCDAVVEIDTHGLSGTYVVDWKSRAEDSEHRCYPEEGAQIGGYAGCDYIIVEGEHGPERRPFPKVDGGLIVSIRPDGARLYPIDLGLGMEHFTRMHAWWCARLDERKAIGRVLPAVKDVRAEVAAAEAKAFDTDAALAWFRRRLAALDDDAKRAVSKRWPDGVPTPKQVRLGKAAPYTLEQARSLDAALAKVEADVGAPFDGRAPWKAPYPTPGERERQRREAEKKEPYRVRQARERRERVERAEDAAVAAAEDAERVAAALDVPVIDTGATPAERAEILVRTFGTKGKALAACKRAAKSLGLPAPRTFAECGNEAVAAEAIHMQMQMQPAETEEH